MKKENAGVKNGLEELKGRLKRLIEAIEAASAEETFLAPKYIYL